MSKRASEVVRERYGHDDEAAHVLPEELFALTGRQEKVAIQLVGMAGAEARPLASLTSVSVSGCEVGQLDPELFVLCPLLQELDVSRNALSCLGTALSSLGVSVSSLNLALNPLSLLSVSFSPPFASPVLHTLSVAGSRVPLPELLSCLPPSLRVLDLSECPHLSFLPAALGDVVPHLSALHANGCNISSWSDVAPALSRLPKLEKLFLSSNPLAEIGPVPAGVLEKLELLAVANTKLSDLSWAAAICHLPCLRHVRFADSPCHRLPRSRLLLLAVLPQLTSLNGSEVPEREKTDAEIIRQKNKLANGLPNQEQPVASVIVRPGLTAQFCSSSGAQSPVVPVAPEMTVSMLRDLAFRHTRVPPFRQRLWAKSAGDIQRIILDQFEASLEWYGFSSGLVDVLVEEAE